MLRPDRFRFSHHGSGVDARLKLISVVHYYPSEPSHSESTAVLRSVAESTTLRPPYRRTSSQHENSLQDDHGG